MTTNTTLTDFDHTAIIDEWSQLSLEEFLQKRAEIWYAAREFGGATFMRSMSAVLKIDTALDSDIYGDLREASRALSFAGSDYDIERVVPASMYNRDAVTAVHRIQLVLGLAPSVIVGFVAATEPSAPEVLWLISAALLVLAVRPLQKLLDFNRVLRVGMMKSWRMVVALDVAKRYHAHMGDSLSYEKILEDATKR